MVAATVDDFRFDFTAEAERLIDPANLVDAQSGVSIWGGEFTANKLPDFLTACDFSGIPNCIWEYAHCIEFAKEQLPNDAERCLLERGRVFGVSGDLSLRRDGGRFLWHFIGRSGVDMPEGFEKRDFWEAHPNTQLRRREEMALLWGQRKENDDSWQEDRVGWATLNYPISDSAAKRVWIKYDIFTEGGQPAFVWWKELQSYA